MKDIRIESKPLGVGLDLGSSAVRISLFDYENDNLLSTTSQKVAYYINDNDPCIFKYTQSTPEILCAIDQCFKNLKIDKFHQNIKSFGIAATCSMVVLNNNSEPYNLIPNNLGKIHDVIFWMDSSSVQECKEANKLIDSSEKDKLGGSGFIAEMAVPKLIRLFKFKKNVVVMDLHKYIAYIMCKKFNWSFKSLVDIPNKNGVAHDGELSGWSNPNILKLVDEAASRIGPVIDTDTKNVMNITSHIDCYTSWFSTFPKPDKSVCVVAGTSTCFLFASSRDNLVIPGVWGPFTNVFEKNNFDKDINVYESGQQTTGILLEHLLQTHPCAIKSGLSQAELHVKINNYLDCNDDKGSVHLLNKYKFLYGDFLGNRTPFADPDVRGMYIGESLDCSFHDLCMKYLCILEFLAFQTKFLIDRLSENITQVYIVGSQAKNKRLLQLIKHINKQKKIKIPHNKKASELMGAEGAYLISKYQSALLEMSTQKRCESFQEIQDPQYTKDICKLLDAKYDIHIDMIKVQQSYIERIKQSIQ